jgi:ribonuclease-3
VQSEAALAIFVHTSLKSSVQNDNFGDDERLAFIGRQVLSMAVTEVLFEKRPMLTAVELESGREEALSDDSYDQWVTQYGMRDKVHCPPELRDELNGPMETRHLFDAYVGALQVEKGYLAVKAWIQPMIDPDFNPNSNQGSTSYGSSGNPLPPASPPPPLPASTIGQGVFLASFNQTASQRGLKIEWEAKQSGPGHALTWNVECLVGGISKGHGVGKSKQLAKEEAARQAQAAMGWGPYA